MPQKWKFAGIALAVGVASALITAASLHFVSPFTVTDGVVFGAALTLLVWIRYKTFSAMSAVSLIASAIPAYCAAVFGTGWVLDLVYLLMRHKFESDPFGPLVFSVAGFLGAWIMLLAVRLLVIREKPWSALWKSAAWACVGALLGFLSSVFSKPVGTALWTVVMGHRPQPQDGTDGISFCSAYLIWQTGMAFAAAWMMPMPEPAISGAHSSPSSIQAAPARLSVTGTVFFLCIYLAMVILIALQMHDWLRG